MIYKIKLRITYFHLFFVALIVCLIFACNKKTTKSDTANSAIATDSIQLLIDAGRDTKNAINFRQNKLVQAYAKTEFQKTDTARLKYLSKIQWSFLDLNDSTWFRKTNKEANLLAHQLDDSLRLGGSFWDLGLFLNRNSVQDSAYYNLSKAQKLYQLIGDTKKAGMLFYDMARIQSDSKDYVGSEINLIYAIELFKPLNDKRWLYNCYNLLGIVLKDLNSFERSLQYYNIAATFQEKNANSNQLQNNIGVTYMQMGDLEQAIGYFEKALNIDSLRTKYPGAYARTLNNLANSQYRLKDHKGIESMLLESLKIRDSIGEQLALAGGYYSLAEYYTFKKDTLKAITNLNKSKVFAEKSSNNFRLLKSLELLTKIDHQNASFHSKKYFALSDSLQQQERAIRNKFARIRYETDEFIAENEVLSKEKQLWTGIAASLVMLGFASFIIISQRVKNQKLRFAEQQQVSNQEIFNLLLAQNEKVEEGKKLEQKRVSEELHDGVLGKMLGTRMMLLGLNKKTDPEAVAERAKAISILQEVESEVRSISHELSHAAYQKIHNFILSIKDLLQTVESTSKINIDFSYADQLDYDALNGNIKINLYRIIQESVQNAVKHAECKNINLIFTADVKSLKVLIVDDGKGFLVKKGKKGIGMRNIASRMQKVNGTWGINSDVGKGTSVSLNIPMVANDTSTSIKIVKEELQEF